MGFRDIDASAAVKLVQQGIARSYSLSQHSSQQTRFPITPAILRGIKASWSQQQYEYDKIMLWAALCTGFFGFFRLGEITAPASTRYDPRIHLTFDDISVDDIANPKSITIHVKKSKTDQSMKGAAVILVKTEQDLCPVAALLSYIAARGDSKGPFFLFKDGQYLTQSSLTFHLRQALSQVGLDPNCYAGHSLRIGAATTAAVSGVQDSTIKALGRWRSTAYQRYIRRQGTDLATVSVKLASNT